VDPERAVLSLRHELARKALHLTSAAVPVAYAVGVPRDLLLALLGVLVLVALLVEMTRRRVALVRQAFVRATEPLLRAHEHHGLAGATWMLVAFALAVWLLPRDAAIAATWAVAVGDASAAIVGKSLGRVRFGSHGKSLEGALACLVATALGAAFVAKVGPAAALAAGAAAALAELPGRPLDDNLRVAAAVALAVTATQLVLARV
jgi:dolichol kinase